MSEHQHGKHGCHTPQQASAEHLRRAFLIEAIWLLVSIVGLVRVWLERRGVRRQRTTLKG